MSHVQDTDSVSSRAHAFTSHVRCWLLDCYKRWICCMHSWILFSPFILSCGFFLHTVVYILRCWSVKCCILSFCIAICYGRSQILMLHSLSFACVSVINLVLNKIYEKLLHAVVTHLFAHYALLQNCLKPKQLIHQQQSICVILISWAMDWILLYYKCGGCFGILNMHCYMTRWHVFNDGSELPFAKTFIEPILKIAYEWEQYEVVRRAS